jgi:hypothetical protein
MEGSGARRNARAHKGQEPRETDVYGPTEAVQRERRARSKFSITARRSGARGRFSILSLNWRSPALPRGCCVPWRVGPFFLNRIEPQAGHASLTIMAAVGLPDGGEDFNQQ